MPQYRTLLVATDFSEDSAAALEIATGIAQRCGAKIELLHVYPRIVDVFHTLGLDLPPPPAPELRRSAAVRIDQELTRVREAGAEARWHLREGDASSQIAEAAGELEADLVVVGTRGRSGLAHAMLGSVAERVSRISPCPVLTVKAGAGAEASAGSH